MCSGHENINFSIEQKELGSILLLAVKIVYSVYRKPAFNEPFTNYQSFIPMYQIRGLFTHVT